MGIVITLYLHQLWLCPRESNVMPWVTRGRRKVQHFGGRYFACSDDLISLSMLLVLHSTAILCQKYYIQWSGLINALEKIKKRKTRAQKVSRNVWLNQEGFQSCCSGCIYNTTWKDTNIVSLWNDFVHSMEKKSVDLNLCFLTITKKRPGWKISPVTGSCKCFNFVLGTEENKLHTQLALSTFL